MKKSCLFFLHCIVHYYNTIAQTKKSPGKSLPVSCSISPLQYMAWRSIFVGGKPWSHSGQDMLVLAEKVKAGISFSASSLLPTWRTWQMAIVRALLYKINFPPKNRKRLHPTLHVLSKKQYQFAKFRTEDWETFSAYLVCAKHSACNTHIILIVTFQRYWHTLLTHEKELSNTVKQLAQSYRTSKWQS